MINHLNNKLPLVVIFGRTNVGKSTLFNCLSDRKRALVSTIEGTTRDSNLSAVSWRKKNFLLVDTGGIIRPESMNFANLKKPPKGEETIEIKVQKQAFAYLLKAQVIIFVTDGKSGLLPSDRQLAKNLKKILTGQKVILAVNKIDQGLRPDKTAEFYQLGFPELCSVSAITGAGTGDLLDAVVKKIKSRKEKEEKEAIKACLIGQPNVGKSSLLNSLLGYERVIVSPVPHTTREPQDTTIIYNKEIIRLIDTAGLSRQGQKTKGLEKFGIIKSLAALDKADLAVLIIDISANITHQDAKLVEEIFKRRKSLLIVANKWDKIKERETKKFTEYIYSCLPFAKFAPIQFTSALTGEKVKKILDLILEIAQARKLIVSDSQLSKFLARLVKIHKPAKGKGFKHPRIYEIKQTRSNPPQFSLRIGPKDSLHESYLHFAANQLRKQFGFTGTPLSIWVEKGRQVHGKAN